MQLDDIFKALKGKKKLSLQNSLAGKTIFQNKGEIKTFQDK